MWGGAGADVFVFAAPTDSPPAHDRILDFEDGIDKLDLSGFDDRAGALHLSDAGHLTGEAGQVVVRVGAHAATVQVDLDGDRHADFTLVLRGGDHDLQASDFIL
jgi:serralysin